MRYCKHRALDWNERWRGAEPVDSRVFDPRSEQGVPITRPA
jgi:hypothetical protein